MARTRQSPAAVPAQASRRSDEALKARHRTMWGVGDYPRVARALFAEFGPLLCDAAGIAPGQRVLDIAAGAGNVAIPAALRGAEVVASDLTPSLLEAGQAAARAVGAELQWVRADAEALPFADASFDAVVSAVGVMFAPHHRAAAVEALRVCRPGGRLALVSWTPGGFVGQMFAVMTPYVAAPPAGSSPPARWGDPEHVADLLGDGVTGLRHERRELRVPALGSPEDFLSFFKAFDGPTTVAYRGLEGRAGRAADLDAALLALARRATADDGVMRWEYLLTTATRT